MYIMNWIKNSWILRFVQQFKYVLDELSFSSDFLPFTYKEVRKRTKFPCQLSNYYSEASYNKFYFHLTG